MPGGTPQGTKLGLFIFLILINFAGFTSLEKQLGEKITRPKSKRTPLSQTHLKYVDDLSLAKAINLKKDLIINPQPFAKPEQFHDRTNHILSNGQMQDELNRLHDYSVEHDMKINIKKTVTMLFNPSKQMDFTPRLNLPGMKSEEHLDVVENHKILGVIISNDMKWHKNTEYICKKGFLRLWILRRLKNLGANTEELLDVYYKQVRSILEFAVPVWHPGITVAESRQIERVQKTALSIILGAQYLSYSNAIKVLDCEELSLRRKNLCTKFARKSFKSPKYRSWFKLNTFEPTMKTRQKKPLLMNVTTRTKRYERSPLPFMTSLLNNS